MKALYALFVLLAAMLSGTSTSRAQQQPSSEPVLPRNEKMQSEINDEKAKKYRRAEYHDGRSITSSADETRRNGSDA